PVDRTVRVLGARPRLRYPRRLERAPGRRAGIREEGEDRRQVGLGGAREPQPVLLRPGVGPFVGADPPRPVVLHAHAREEAAARAPPSVRTGVVLLEGPQSGSIVLDDGPFGAPRGELTGRLLVGFRADGKVDANDVVGR